MNKALVIALILLLIHPLSYSQTRSSSAGDCPKPTGEITSWIGWNSPSTLGMWRCTLTPASIDFAGKSVTERDGGGGNETCFFVGSIYPHKTALTANSKWSVGPGNKWQADSIGWYPRPILYYRNQGRAPCEFVWTQKMFIICPSGNNEYKSHLIKAGFTATEVYSERDGQRTTKYWQ